MHITFASPRHALAFWGREAQSEEAYLASIAIPSKQRLTPLQHP